MRKPQLPAAPAAVDHRPDPDAGLAAEQARLRDGLGLPQAWRQRPHFGLLFMGENWLHGVLAAWDAWQRDLERPAQLHLLVMDPCPPSAESLTGARAHANEPQTTWVQALAEAWPPRTPGWHRLALDAGRVHLTLAWGEVVAGLPEWQATVDAVVLTQPLDERGWAALARLVAPGARLLTAPGAPLSGAALAQGFASMPGSTDVAVFSPRHQALPPLGRRVLAPDARSAIVVGAGLAGAACARVLRRQGLSVTVLEGGATVAAGASGNPGGLFHGTVHPDDGPHARWNRAAALHLRHVLTNTPLPWRLDGLARLAPELSLIELQALIDTLALPPDYVQALAPEALRQISGLPLDTVAWLYPGGGALPPAALVQHWLSQVTVRLNCPIDACHATADGWAVSHQGQHVAQADLLVLAAGAALPALLHPLDPDLAALLTPQRGQVSWLDAPTAAQAARPLLPVAAGGYALPLPDGRLVVGATSHEADLDPTLRADDHAANARHWQRLCGAPQGVSPTHGRVAWRLLAPDRLPVVGGLIDPTQTPPVRATQASAWARRPGLVVCGALASRGITSSALAGELAAALALGLPAPVERSLIDALDPARFAVRALRRGSGVSKP